MVQSETPTGIWIAWEQHRRSRELARAVGVELWELSHSGPYLLRAVVLSWRTFRLVCHLRPRVLVVQNPSMALAALAVFLRPIFGYFLIVDRHSNFKLHTTASRSPKYRIFHALSRYTLRNADLTIVTNDALAERIAAVGGRPFVLPDKIPDLPLARNEPLGKGHHIVYVCSFDDDEPLDAVLAAADLLGADYHLHVTGNFQRREWAAAVAAAPDNVEFTGFLPEEEYQTLLASADVVLTLTTMPHIMQCGGYEAVSVGTPLVFGPDPAMVSYFSAGCVSTVLGPDAIAAALRTAIADGDELSSEIQVLRRTRDSQWQGELARLLALLPGAQVEAVKKSRGNGSGTQPGGNAS